MYTCLLRATGYRVGLWLIIRKITLNGSWPALLGNGSLGQATGQPIDHPEVGGEINGGVADKGYRRL
jgi:hypothetical protein